jgi:hypothetical protein
MGVLRYKLQGASYMSQGKGYGEQKIIKEQEKTKKKNNQAIKPSNHQTIQQLIKP